MKSLFLYFLILLSIAGTAQGDSSFTMLRTYKGNVAHAALDHFDNLYIVSTTGQIKKLNNRGDSVAVFNGVRNFGKLTTIDVTNPLKPLLFYKDFSAVVVLDRLLASRASFDLRRYNLLQATAIGLSYDNNIWVFDQYDYKLKKIDESGNLLVETPDFRQVLNVAIAPQRIINDNGLVYLADSAKGIFVFDNYGSFKKKITLKGWSDIDVQNGKIIYISRRAVLVYDPTNFIERSFAYPSTFVPYTQAFTSGKQLVTFSTDSLSIYRIGN